ncbi:acyltransferase [Aliikangiella sp. IMCC44359]|uniref:acyltransferase n=1 Tax=Aliikangiella sp. IMCC44359 TaxID=3459125 RepID=UPI00403AEA6F
MRILSKASFKKSNYKFVKRNITGQNNIIQADKAICSNVTYNIQGDNNIIVIHPNAYLNNVSFNLYGNNHRIFIGQHCRFNERGSIWAEDKDCFISIGQHTTFEGVHLSATEPGSKLIIGEDCMFSYDIDVRTGDSHSIISKANGKRTNYAKDIIFGDHIWVASHCIFTRGVSIASYSIVGTGSLVNRQFTEENVLIAGRPAKVLKKDIEWLRERVYHTQAISTLPDSGSAEAITKIAHDVVGNISKKTG